MDDETRDQLTMGQTEAIKDQIKAEQPLIDTMQAVISLLDQYKDAELPGFAKGIVDLNNKYRGLRKVRGDGNCFYRAFLYGYLDILVKLNESKLAESVNLANAERDRVLEVVKNSMNDLVAVGYSEFTIETFYEEFVELLTGLFDLTSESLLQLFQTENGSAEYYTWFMRLLTAGFIKKEADRFTPFIEGSYMDVYAFCTSEVEPMGKECEQLQIIALTEYLGISVEIAYLDGRSYDESAGVSLVTFPDPSSGLPTTKQFAVTLLYRPGHYDILYKN